MDNAIYASLGRQSGLMSELRAIANNIANSSTTGFRREGVIFAEQVRRLSGVEPSLSMAAAEGRTIDLSQAPLRETGGTFDFAIEGAGFFLIQTPDGNRLSRAGTFTPSAEGGLVTADGSALLDDGGAPIAIPPAARTIALSRDGTLSADGAPVARIGLWLPADQSTLVHEGGTRFAFAGEPVPVDDPQIFQGFVEGSNVEPLAEIARLIEVQRGYELGQSLLDREDERIRSVIRTFSG